MNGQYEQWLHQLRHSPEREQWLDELRHRLAQRAYTAYSESGPRTATAAERYDALNVNDRQRWEAVALAVAEAISELVNP